MGKKICLLFLLSGLCFIGCNDDETIEDGPTVPETLHEYVDLGLPSGTKWATCNVGANFPEEFGGYYAWGETNEKTYYSWDTYAYYGSKFSTGISGTQYDVAHVKWGGNWHMPTRAQCKELCDYCSSIQTSMNGVSGVKVTGPNGNSIFLPVAGRRLGDEKGGVGLSGDYWSDSLYDGNDNQAYFLIVFPDRIEVGNGQRTYGRSVRPVCP